MGFDEKTLGAIFGVALMVGFTLAQITGCSLQWAEPWLKQQGFMSVPYEMGRR